MLEKLLPASGRTTFRPCYIEPPPPPIPLLPPQLIAGSTLRLSDQAAQAFGASFYHALIIGGYTVKHAFDIALNLVNASGRDAIPQGDNFLLLPEGKRV